MRFAVATVALVLVGCGSDPQPAVQAKSDPTSDAAYSATVTQLAGIDRQAEQLFKDGKPDDAAALIQKGEGLAAKVLGVSRPSLEAVEAASDLDDLYGRMFLSNHRYGWARLMFQKNLARWKHWEPQTAETERRLKHAQTEIALCDRNIEK